MFCGSGGSKIRLAKVAGTEPSGEMRDKNCTPLWREAHFEVKMVKTPVSEHFRKFEMLKKSTALWCKSYLDVKMVNPLRPRATSGR